MTHIYIYNNRHRQLIQMRHSPSPSLDLDAAQGWSQPSRLAPASQGCWAEREGVVERGQQKQNTAQQLQRSTRPHWGGWPAQKAMTNSLKGSGAAQKRRASQPSRFHAFPIFNLAERGVGVGGESHGHPIELITPLPSLFLLLFPFPPFHRPLDPAPRRWTSSMMIQPV